MKKVEELAAEYVLNEIDPSDYVDMAPDLLAHKIFVAAYRMGYADAKAESEKEKQPK